MVVIYYFLTFSKVLLSLYSMSKIYFLRLFSQKKLYWAYLLLNDSLQTDWIYTILADSGIRPNIVIETVSEIKYMFWFRGYVLTRVHEAFSKKMNQIWLLYAYLCWWIKTLLYFVSMFIINIQVLLSFLFLFIFSRM